MNKIVMITGSPRKNGNSNRMANSFEQSAKKNGIEIIRIDATKLKLDGCHACNACFKNNIACAITKEFTPIAEAIMSADGIVMTMPVYWYSMPSQIKAIMDHFYSFCVAGKDFSGKKCALIACCEENNMETFSGVEFGFRKSMELMKCEIVGNILIPGVNKPGEIENTDGEKQAAELVKKFVNV